MKKVYIEIDVADRPGLQKVSEALDGLILDLDKLNLGYSIRVEQQAEDETYTSVKTTTTSFGRDRSATFGFADPQVKEKSS